MFVAHRLRTIYDADQILVLKDGNVAESGNHLQLLEQNGVYAELWNGEFVLSLLFRCRHGRSGHVDIGPHFCLDF